MRKLKVGTLVRYAKPFYGWVEGVDDLGECGRLIPRNALALVKAVPMGDYGGTYTLLHFEPVGRLLRWDVCHFQEPPHPCRPSANAFGNWEIVEEPDA